MEPLAGAALLAMVGASFAVSAAVGLGGSLLLVPTLVVALGPKEGVALAALLLGANNVWKVVAYRQTLPWRDGAAVILLLSAGAAVGARVLVSAPEPLVATGVIAAIAGSLLAERRGLSLRRTGGPAMALGAGLTSGFSGTSGPLKGAALRSLGLDRAHLVGGASLASLFGDLTKATVFADAGLLDGTSLGWTLAALPLMPLATFAGRTLNRRVGDARYSAMFWTVMGGYVVRLVVS